MFLLFSLHSEERVFPNLHGGIPIRVRILEGHEAGLASLFLKFLMLVALEKVVYPPLAQEEALELFGRAALSIARSLVHPFYTVDSFLSAGRL